MPEKEFLLRLYLPLLGWPSCLAGQDLFPKLAREAKEAVREGQVVDASPVLSHLPLPLAPQL